MAVLWLYHHPCPLYFHYFSGKILLQTGFSKLIRANQWGLYRYCGAVFQHFLFGFRYTCSGVCASLSDGNHSENFYCPDADFIIYLKLIYQQKFKEKRMTLFSFFIYFIIKKTSLNILDKIKTHLIIRCVFIFLSSKFNYSADSSFAAFSEDFF